MKKFGDMDTFTVTVTKCQILIRCVTIKKQFMGHCNSAVCTALCSTANKGKYLANFDQRSHICICLLVTLLVRLILSK